LSNGQAKLDSCTAYMNKHFGGVIWTNHAISRMKQRGIKQSDAWATWRRPDQSRYAKIRGAWVYYKTYGNERIEVVAKRNEKKEWLILSVWSRRVFEKHKPKRGKASGPKGRRPGGKQETIGGYLFRKLIGRKQ